MHTSSKILADSPQQSLFSQLCHATQHTPFVHEDETLAVRHVCTSTRENMPTCQDKDINIFVDEVGGLDMLNVSISGRVNILEKFIPIIPRGMFNRPAHEVPYEVVGVMINDILTKRLRYRNGFYIFPEDTNVDTTVLQHPIFRGKKVILFSAGQDTLIEGVWWRRHEMEFFAKIASMGFFAVTGMNFSLFFGECPFGHALNIKKSLCYCSNLDMLGVWVIPHVYAINRFQCIRWKEWLLANPTVRMITINTQLQKNQHGSMANVFDTVRYILENTSVGIILHGRVSGIPTDLKQKFSSRLHYAASGPMKNALIRKAKTTAEYIIEFLQKIDSPHQYNVQLLPNP